MGGAQVGEVLEGSPLAKQKLMQVLEIETPEDIKDELSEIDESAELLSCSFAEEAELEEDHLVERDTVKHLVTPVGGRRERVYGLTSIRAGTSKGIQPSAAIPSSVLDLFEIPKWKMPREIDSFSKVYVKGRHTWNLQDSSEIYFEFVDSSRKNAIKRFLVQDILAFQDSEEDYLELGRPGEHEVWAALNSNNGLLAVVYDKSKLHKIDDKINGNDIYSNGRFLNSPIFEDLLGGIYLRLEQRNNKNFLRVYSLAANPHNKERGINGVGTKLVKFVANALRNKNNQMQGDFDAIVFNFYWLNHKTNACYFANNPELSGVINSILYDERKLSGMIPISDACRLEFEQYHSACAGLKPISLENALEEKYHQKPFKVIVPKTELHPKNYTDEHRAMIELLEHMFTQHHTVAVPKGNGEKKISYSFIPRD